MSKKTISFVAIDSWFFRESRPMDANGESQSIFPPGIRTVSGAIRTLIGEQLQVNWQDFKANEAHHPLKEIIGSNKEGDLGKLTFKGVWISQQNKRLYPAPLHLMEKQQKLYILKLAGKGIFCDQGKNIRLPELPCEQARGSKPLESTWIDEETFQLILEGATIKYDKDHFFALDHLITQETRTGIARNNALRTVQESMLYQTQHVRPNPDINLEVDVNGLPDDVDLCKTLVRLGGESRAANLLVKDQCPTLPVIDKKNVDFTKSQGIIIYLLSPLQMQYENHKKHPLPDFTFKEQSDQTSYWHGYIAGVALKLHGAVVGKSIRDGGWDMAKHQPRDDRSLTPAGSVFFCEVESGDIANAIALLHGKQIGELQQYGYGLMAVGIWN
jgi:CRISPR-associated protein Cmr3